MMEEKRMESFLKQNLVNTNKPEHETNTSCVMNKNLDTLNGSNMIDSAPQV